MSEFVAPSVRTFQVVPDVPADLQPLAELARNFWWVWQPEAVELFRRLDRPLWEDVHHNPVKLLGQVAQGRLVEAARDEGYLANVRRVHAAFRKDLAGPGWFGSAHAEVGGDVGGDGPPLHVAYFSAEFGLHESLPIYSGGLGVLAGDHLKSASDLSVPLTAVGLLYRQGYFTQTLAADGRQQEAYPELDFYNLAVDPARGIDSSQVKVRVDLPEGPVTCAVWRVSVGRVPLYLLDTNLPENRPADRDITGRLYGGGTEMRIRQEIVLGIGGTRALAALRVPATVFHMNEGHSAFSALERIRVLLEHHPDLSFDDVRQAVMATSIFTTHTPVPAGIDTFSPDLMRQYFGHFHPLLKLDEEGFLALGREDVHNRVQGFSMAVLAIRLADATNGVSQLHGEVSRRMWHNLWPQVPPDDVPIASVTNGIHVRTWLAPELSALFDRYLGRAWKDGPADPAAWEGIANVPDEELWRAHERCRERLVTYARSALRDQLVRRGAGYDQVAIADEAPGPRRPDHRLRPAVRHVQAGRAAAERPGPAGQAAGGRQAAGPVRVRRQGPPGRQRRQGRDPGDRQLRPRERPRAAAAGVPGELRHGRRPAVRPGRRRVAEHPPPGHGGQRHERHEGGRQRHPQLLDPGRLVGRGVRPRRRLGDRPGRGVRRPRAAGQGRGERPLRPARTPDRPPVLPAGQRRPGRGTGWPG